MNSGYHEHVEGGAGNSRLKDKSAGKNSDATIEGDRLTLTSMKHVHYNVCINEVSDHTNTLST